MIAPAAGTALPRTRARRGEGDKLRAEILEAAEKLLILKGSQDAVSIREVAIEAGCTPPSIYMHFHDKDQLFLEVCSRRFRELDSWIEEAGSRSDDPLESLRARGAAYVRFGIEHPEAYRLLMMTRTEGTIDDPGKEAGKDAFMHMVEAVDRCVKAGVLGDADAYETSLVLWSGIHGLTSLFISFPNFEWGDQEDLVERMLDVMIEGLLSV